MNGRWFLAGVLMAFTCVAGFGCSGGGSDGGEPGAAVSIDSGLSQDRVAGSLSEAEADQLCMAYQSAIDSTFSTPSVKSGLCGFDAYVNSVEVSECAAKEAACDTEFKPSAGCAFADLQQCDATVEELEGCYVQLIETNRDYYRGLTCKSLHDSIATDTFPDGPFAEKCYELRTRCRMTYPTSSTSR